MMSMDPLVYEVAVFELTEPRPYKVLRYEFISKNVSFTYGQGVTGYIETPVDIAPGEWSLIIHCPNHPRLRDGNEDKFWYAFFPVATLIRSDAGYLVICDTFVTDKLEGELGAAALEVLLDKQLKLSSPGLLQAAGLEK